MDLLSGVDSERSTLLIELIKTIMSCEAEQLERAIELLEHDESLANFCQALRAYADHADQIGISY